jgi:adenylate cyclase
MTELDPDRPRCLDRTRLATHNKVAFNTGSDAGAGMVEQRLQRRLAAILAGDVAGYSRLMGADEEGTLSRLNVHRREFLEPKIADYRGRIVKRTGDGVLIEFASAVDATRCAVEIQHGMAERNAPVPQDRRIELRIGIHVGDVIIEDGDIFGDVVNVAARLEGIAQPGGICISDDAYRQVRGKLNADFPDAGEHELKNIARPVRVYQLQQSSGRATEAPALTLPSNPSIAVLPFQNMRVMRTRNISSTGRSKTSSSAFHASNGYSSSRAIRPLPTRVGWST